MSKAIQRRRGTTAQHTSFTGLVGEITVDTTKNTAVIHDGVTAGGTPLAKEVHNHDAAYVLKAHESSTTAHPEMTASDAEVDAGTGSKWVKVSQLIRATVKMITDILPVTLGGTGASTAAGARNNLGLGSVAIENTVPLSKGGTGATTAHTARTNLGLGDAATRTTATVATASRVPLTGVTGKLDKSFIPDLDIQSVPNADYATTAGHATTAGSANTASQAQTATVAQNSDTVDGAHASQTPNPNTIPVADAQGKLHTNWLPPMEASTLGGYYPSLTAGANRIPVANAQGKLDANFLPSVGLPLDGSQVMSGNLRIQKGDPAIGFIDLTPGGGTRYMLCSSKHIGVLKEDLSGWAMRVGPNGQMWVEGTLVLNNNTILQEDGNLKMPWLNGRWLHETIITQIGSNFLWRWDGEIPTARTEWVWGQDQGSATFAHAADGVWRCRMFDPGHISVYFEARLNVNGPIAAARVYRNGAIIFEEGGFSTTWVARGVNFTVNRGDIISIEVIRVGGTSGYAVLRNIRVHIANVV